MMKKNNQKKRMRTAIPFLAILVIFVLFKILQPERFGTAHSINVLIQQTLMAVNHRLWSIFSERNGYF